MPKVSADFISTKRRPSILAFTLKCLGFRWLLEHVCMDFVPVKTFRTFPSINVRDSTNSTEILQFSVIVWNCCRLEISFSKLLYSDKINSLLSFTNCNFIGLQKLSDWADLLFQIISPDGPRTILREIRVVANKFLSFPGLFQNFWLWAECPLLPSNP